MDAIRTQVVPSNMINPEDQRKLQSFFPALPFDNVSIVLTEKDGPGGVGGWVPGNLWAPPNVVNFDSSDVKLINGYLDLSDLVTLEIVAHEYTHLEQGFRGFWYRFKMWFWRTFYKGGSVETNKRPHEIEAYVRGKIVVAQWG